ncbi:murein hydrolase activator EnvC family protein [Devosia nitrariae]|uniref:Membrane protein n=1 Tax=Devosia nitrariae TaxID=2071872 RepID=A0ABQ5W2R8_9HYPH|nr:peptidoglycan DD-metalloendopeptidase family protein [Devosia nitrariae]GLQ54328.1 membrane protein [Devosia nitrariae]
MGLVLALAFGWPVIAQTEPQDQTSGQMSPPVEQGAQATGNGAPAQETSAGTADPTADPDPEPATAEEAQATLEEIERSITLSRERADELRQEIADMEGDRTRQNAALIAAAQRVKLAEIEIDDIEVRLDELIVSELEVRGRLDGADTEIANVLAALARISRSPPPALIVDPSDALGSARGALLISALLPQLQDKAMAITADLTRLTEIKAKAQEEEQLLRANFAVLEEEQLRIATLILARKRGVEIRNEQLAEEEREALALAERATSLKDLIESLSARANAAGTPAEDVPAMSEEAIRVALANAARTEPAVPFAQARGWLARPANGVTVVDYGANDGFGGIAQGVSITTRAEAQVVAPADGWVLYKGPYLNYGQIVILNTGQNYTALLAGLETVTVDIGQFVLMGEPVGTMGSRTIGRTVTTSAGNSQPTLYIELRRDNEPIDPTGWWANEAQTT